MRNNISEKIEMPQGIEVSLDSGILTIKKGNIQSRKKLSISNIKVNARKENNSIVLEAKSATRKEIRLINTIKSHIRNMVRGLDRKFKYRLKVCSVHFPISVSKEGNTIIIKNFLGEDKPRKAKILGNAEVKIEKDIITIESFDKEAAGQTAANIENATRIRARDRRVFQDGIFLVSRNDKEI